MAGTDKASLSLLPMTAMVVGTMLGAGIFNLPARFASATGPFGAIIAWSIAGSGMYMLARVFQFLARSRPDLDTGVFAYAKAGFGDYMGFLSAFGYWLGACLGNVFYWLLIGSTLGDFFPQLFGEGSTWAAIALSLCGIWAFHAMILGGIRRATFVNLVITAAKVALIIAAVLLLAAFFNYDQFTRNFFGGVGMPEKPLFEQVRDAMLVTVFVFLGVEGASVYSRFARRRKDIGRATILGFVAVTGLMVAVTLLPYTIAPRATIASMSAPSLAGTLELAVGPWGAVFVSIAVLVSILGAYLAWSLICAEVVYAAARARNMPKLFATQNGNGVPANALWLTNIVVSVLVVSTYWSDDAVGFMLDMTSITALLPFLLVAGYGVMVARRGIGYAADDDLRGLDQIVAWIALAYILFLFFAAGLHNVLLVAVLFVLGTVILYFWARSEQQAPLFSPREVIAFAVTVVAGGLGAVGLSNGTIIP